MATTRGPASPETTRANWPEPGSSDISLGDGRFATVVERPGSVEALRDAVARRAAEGLAIYPQGGRTALDYGGVPRLPGAAIDLRGLDRVVDYPAADMTITVEAGITLAALAAILDAEGQRLDIDAPEPEAATLGGVFATNATGPNRYGRGRPRDQVLGVAFVSADGTLVRGGGRVVKNVAGYDFPRLLTGSLGTLGVIAELTVKVRPKPEAAALVRLAYRDLAALSPDLDRLNTSATRPVAIEVGRGDRGGWALHLAFEDNAASVAWQIERAGVELFGAVERIDEGAASDEPRRALRDFAAIRTGSISVAINVRPSAVVATLDALDPGLWTCQAHAGTGVVRAHAIVDDLARVEADVRRLRGLAARGDGNLIVARCPTAMKARLPVWGERRPDWAWHERVKAALDPGGLMNPGRFVGTI